MNVLHEGVDIGARLGAEIEVIGVLVHVERQDRHAAGEAVGVVRRPLDRQPVLTLRPGEQGPARAAGLCLGASRELGAPAGDTAEIPLQRGGEIAAGIARTAEPVEVNLVQDRRVGGDQFLPLQSVDVEDRCRAPIERVKPALDRVQATNRAAIIVLVVARQQPFGETVEAGRLERKRHDPVHGFLTGSTAYP